MECPRCDGKLSPLRGAANVVVDYCDHCDGVWFDKGEFADFYNMFGPVPFLDEGADLQQGVICPRCTTRMVEVSYPPHDGVRVDICRGCEGLWLDKGESAELREKVRALQATMDRLDTVSAAIEAPREKVSINWTWVALGLVIIVGAQFAFSGFFQIIAALDDLGDRDARLSDEVIGALSTLLAYPVGGFFIGRFSSGFTIWEPAIAAIPAAAWMVAREGGAVGYMVTTVIVLLGVGLAVLGAAGGERRQSAGS